MDTENEIEVTTEVEANPIESIVDAIVAGDFNNAGDMFNGAMSDRIANALDAKRVEVGSGISFDDIDFDEADLDVQDQFEDDESIEPEEE